MGDLAARFVLGNAYYLVEEAARGRLELVDETMAKLARLGVTVVRTWGFNDDPNKADSAIRLRPGALHEPGLRGLDRVLARARAHGLRLILPLVNYWDAYGGARQWCRWQGLPDPREGDPRFFTDGGVRRAFEAHLVALLERRNEETGVRHGEDPTVLAWELMNEPRSDGLREVEWLGWIAETAGLVRVHAGQLLSLGDEGHDRYRSHLALPELQLASLHVYPEKYGVPEAEVERSGLRWIEEGVAHARAAGKPLYIGELGLGNEGASFARFDLAARRRIYRRWFDAAIAAGALGFGPWLFAYDSRPDAWDDFTWYCRDGLPLDAPENRYADLVAEAAAQLSGAPPPSR